MATELATSDSKQAPPPNVRSLLVAWANQQDAWIRALVSDVIVTAKPLTEQQLNILFDLFLKEKHLRPNGQVLVEPLRDDPIDAGKREQLVLKRIEELKNVNALAAGQSIAFAPKLTVIFGENAAGKTGYVRVLKRAAAVRTAETILPNVNTASAGPASARFVYAIGTTETPLDWHDEAGVAPLNRIDVFDSRATLLHVDTDLTYIYTPGELSRFPLVQRGIEHIRTRLEAAIKDASTTANPFLAHFDRASRLYAFIESLGAATDLNKLHQFASVPAEEEVQVPTLRTEIEALKSTTPQAQLRVAEAQTQHAISLTAGVQAVRQFDPVGYKQARQVYMTARERYEGATTSSFAGITIPGLLQQEWKRFIQAGEEYINHSDITAEYPQAGEPCAYCRQPLGTEAVGLIKKYRDYCNGAFRSDVNRAEADLEKLSQAMLGLDIQKLTGQLAEFAAASGFLSVENQKRISALLDRVAQLQVALAGKGDIDADGLAAEASAATAALEPAAASTDALIADLKSRSEKREQTLKERQAQLLDIESRQMLAKLLPEVEKFVETAKWADAADRRLTEVLSEGEQKVIALADFLAEIALKPPAPVILDDPITSLDYRRMSEVVARIVELSQTRQIIVFTHNIWFTTELLSAFEKAPQDCGYYDVTRDGGQVGVITKGSHPRSDTFKASRGKINDLVQTAQKLTGESQMAIVEKAYEYLRNVCEVIVELELLQGVTQRYQPNVRMTSLPNIKCDRLQAAVQVIYPIFEDCCRYILRTRSRWKP